MQHARQQGLTEQSYPFPRPPDSYSDPVGPLAEARPGNPDDGYVQSDSGHGAQEWLLTVLVPRQRKRARDPGFHYPQVSQFWVSITPFLLDHASVFQPRPTGQPDWYPTVVPQDRMSIANAEYRFEFFF